MAARNGLQLAHQVRTKIPRSVYGVRRYLGNNAGDGLWRSCWGRDTSLNLGHELIAFISAAVRVRLRRLKTVVLPGQIVGQDYAQPPGIRLIQRSQLPQVVDGLDELPVRARACTPVERRQAHAAAAARVLHVDQLAFHA